MSLNPDAICRKKLRGKVATNKDFALEVAKLSKGNSQENVYAMTDNQIAEILGFKHYTSIQNFKVLAKDLGFFNDSEEANVNKSKYHIQEDIQKFIDMYPSVQVWAKDMDKRARGGKPFQGKRSHLRKFKSVCDTLEMHPDQFIRGLDRRSILDSAQDCLKTFMDIYMEGKAKIQYSGKYGQPWDAKYVNRAMVQYSNAQPLTDFMKSHGYPFPIGYGGTTSQSIQPFHGQHSQIRFESWNMYQQIKNYIIKEWGLDSDVFRWFAVGVEALPRAEAIRTMTNTFEPVMRGNTEYYVMEVIEQKTIHIEGGKWQKYIRDADTKKSIDLVKKRSSYVIENRGKTYPTAEIYPKLKQTYIKFGLDKIDRRFEEISESSYFMAHASHALRHCGAQLWLDATNWHVEFVASMGWHTTEELIKSYGRMDAQRRLKVLDNAEFK